MKSFKQMIQAGEVKRADAMKVLLADIHEEAGFNLRVQDADFHNSVRVLADYIKAGGTYPALEVRPREEGGVFVVDGHRRRLALQIAQKEGAPIEWVNVVAFNGNDADRVARIISSAEGRALKPLEMAAGYKRLTAFGKTPDEIASMVGKTRQHVDQLLILANSNTDVQKLVAAGGVSAAVAVRVARKHGENAGKVLDEELGKAKAAGKRKVTDGTMKPKALPPKVVAGVVDELDAFMGGIPTETRFVLAELDKRAESGADLSGAVVHLPASIVVALGREFAKLCEARDKQAEKARAKAGKAAQGELAA